MALGTVPSFPVSVSCIAFDYHCKVSTAFILAADFTYKVPDTMASLDTPEHHVPVPTMVFLAFVEAALALVNSGLPFLPDDELEYVSVHLERAVADATQEGRVRRTGFARPLASLTGHGTSAAYSAPVLLTPPSMLSSDLGGLEAHVQSLKLQGKSVKLYLSDAANWFFFTKRFLLR